MARPKVQRGLTNGTSTAVEERPRRSRADRNGILHVEGMDKNREYRWVNDKNAGQRILSMLDMDWRMETSKTLAVGDVVEAESSAEGTQIKRFVGGGKDGLPMFAYLMSIDRDLYEEDQKFKQQEIDTNEEAILYGTPEGADYAKERSIETRNTQVKRR